MEEDNFKYLPQLTVDEIDALGHYKGESYVGINGILEDESSYNEYTGDMHPFASWGYENPQMVMDIICNLYSAIYKMSKQRNQQGSNLVVYRGTNVHEVERYKRENKFDKFLSTSSSRRLALRKIFFRKKRRPCTYGNNYITRCAVCTI